MAKDGIVPIHGREYKTVALRVSEFRAEHPDWSITTELVDRNAEDVVIKASVLNDQGRVIGTGFAEERRNASTINKTSALENCETSAIGRALSACGYAGTEYASANEVQNAIHQQKSGGVGPARKAVLSESPNYDKEAAQSLAIDLVDQLVKYRESDDNGKKQIASNLHELTESVDQETYIAAYDTLNSKDRALVDKMVDYARALVAS